MCFVQATVACRCHRSLVDCRHGRPWVVQSDFSVAHSRQPSISLHPLPPANAMRQPEPASSAVLVSATTNPTLKRPQASHFCLVLYEYVFWYESRFWASDLNTEIPQIPCPANLKRDLLDFLFRFYTEISDCVHTPQPTLPSYLPNTIPTHFRSSHHGLTPFSRNLARASPSPPFLPPEARCPAFFFKSPDSGHDQIRNPVSEKLRRAQSFIAVHGNGVKTWSMLRHTNTVSSKLACIMRHSQNIAIRVQMVVRPLTA